MIPFQEIKVGRLIKLAVCGPSMAQKKANNWLIAPIKTEDGISMGMRNQENTARRRN